MLGLTLFLFPVIEIIVLYKVGTRVGVVNTLFALLASFVFGLGIAKAQGRYVLAKLQGALNQNAMPAKDVQHSLIFFLAGLLFAIPGFISDVVAILLLLPGTRHLIVRMFRSRFERQLRNGNFKAFSFGRFSGGGFNMDFRNIDPNLAREADQRYEREVSPKVIDVSPISSNTTKKPGPGQRHD